MSAFKNFYIKPSPGELIETLMQLEPDRRSAVCCTVLDKKGAVVPDALALLFRPSQETEKAVLIQQTFTDEAGQFIFGPLESETLYVIKVFKNGVKLRELEIVAD